VKYPPTWVIQQDSDLTTFSNVAQTSSISNEALQSEASFRIRILVQANPNGLPITDWFGRYFAQGFPVNPISTATTAVDGLPALSIETAEIGNWTHLYVARGQDVFEISCGLFAPRFLEQYTSILSTFHLK